MTDAVRHLIATAMAEVKHLGTGTAYAPSNIALSKYWGKRDPVRNLPLNSSVSISLADWGTHTQVSAAPSGEDEVLLNETRLSAEDPVARRALDFADLFRGDRDLPLRIETRNTIPTAAGLASSASGFAALTRALCATFELDLTETDMSRIARLGSGSAARSLWHGFVRWDKGARADGWDSHGEKLDVTWPAFRIALVRVDVAPKTRSSRDAMTHTVNTSPLFPAWPAQAEADCSAIIADIAEHRFEAVGARAEANALAMHATILAARPSLSYLTPQSWHVLDQLWRARSEGLCAYATMDAGPNVKLIFLEKSTSDLHRVFPEATVIAPFG